MEEVKTITKRVYIQRRIIPYENKHILENKFKEVKENQNFCVCFGKNQYCFTMSVRSGFHFKMSTSIIVILRAHPSY